MFWFLLRSSLPGINLQPEDSFLVHECEFFWTSWAREKAHGFFCFLSELFFYFVIFLPVYHVEYSLSCCLLNVFSSLFERKIGSIHLWEMEGVLKSSPQHFHWRKEETGTDVGKCLPTDRPFPLAGKHYNLVKKKERERGKVREGMNPWKVEKGPGTPCSFFLFDALVLSFFLLLHHHILVTKCINLLERTSGETRKE